MFDEVFDDINGFLGEMYDSYQRGEEFISEPTIDNYGRYQTERGLQAIAFGNFKKHHARDIAAAMI